MTATTTLPVDLLLADVAISADERASLRTIGVCSASWRGARIALRRRATRIGDAQSLLAAYGDRLAFLKSLRHPNCVPFYGACLCEGIDDVLFAFEWVGPPATVAARLRRNDRRGQAPFAYREIIDVAGDVLAGLRYLESRAHPMTRSGVSAAAFVTSEGVILTERGKAMLADVTSGIFEDGQSATSARALPGPRGMHFVTFSTACLILEMCTGIPVTVQYDLDRYNASLHGVGVNHPLYVILKRSMEPPPNCPTPSEMAAYLEKEKRSQVYLSGGGGGGGGDVSARVAHLDDVVEQCSTTISRLQKNVAQLQHALFKVVTEHKKSTTRFSKQIRLLTAQNRLLREHVGLTGKNLEWNGGSAGGPSPLIQHQQSSLDGGNVMSSSDELAAIMSFSETPLRSDDGASGMSGAVSTESMVAEVAEGDISALLNVVQSVAGANEQASTTVANEAVVARLDELVAGFQHFGSSTIVLSSTDDGGDDDDESDGNRSRRAVSVPSPDPRHAERRFPSADDEPLRRHSDATRTVAARLLLPRNDLLPPVVPLRTTSLRSLNNAASSSLESRSTPAGSETVSSTTTTTTTTTTSNGSPGPSGVQQPMVVSQFLNDFQPDGLRSETVTRRQQRQRRRRRPHSAHELSSQYAPSEVGATATAGSSQEAELPARQDEATPSEVAGFVPRDRPITAAVARALTSAESMTTLAIGRKGIPPSDSPTPSAAPPMDEAPPPYEHVVEERRQEAARRVRNHRSASPPSSRRLQVPDRNTRTRFGDRRVQPLTRAARSFGTYPASTVWSRTFRFGKHFDKNGVIYYLGTGDTSHSWRNPAEMGIVRVARSGDESQARGRPADALNRKKGTTCSTCNEPLSFFCFDFGPRRSLIPNYYTVRHGAAGKWSALRTWDFEGSVDGTTWIILRRHQNDVSLKGKYVAASWPIELEPAPSPLRYLRIRQTGPNSTGGFHLCVSGFEVYGTLYEENVF